MDSCEPITIKIKSFLLKALLTFFIKIMTPHDSITGEFNFQEVNTDDNTH